MNRFADKLALVSITLWVGALWAIGYLAAPVLFSVLDDKSLAGMLAGRMFTLVAYVGMGSGAYLLVHRLVGFGSGALKQGFFWAALAMLLLAVAGHFGIQPILESLKNQALPKEVMESMFRDRFARWHGVSSIVYLIQSLLGVVLVLAPRRG
ncbi:MAG: DUF4149 domain-containing protein [Sulfuricella denitrificans]|nr:DUF4149 domain-containing protein [Sulfuricella denitrificans]